MFERRLKTFLSILAAVTAILVLRPAQLQVVQKEQWRQKALEAGKRSRLVDTRRGKILDVWGKEMAVDQLCIDACVHYAALSPEPDEKWVTAVALERLQNRMRDEYRQRPKP